MKTVRPYQIFDLLRSDERNITLPIPSGPNGYGVSLLEKFILISVMKTVRPKRLFEFGTWKGLTTCALGMNGDPAMELVTLDIESQLTCRDWPGPFVFLLGDSKTIDLSPWYGKCGMVFVDGGHDEETVESDSRKAFCLIDGGLAHSPQCIAWHDYQRPEYPAVTRYLDSLDLRKLVHVGDTSLVLWLDLE